MGGGGVSWGGQTGTETNHHVHTSNIHTQWPETYRKQPCSVLSFL